MALLLAGAVAPTSASAVVAGPGFGICPAGVGVGLLEVPKDRLKDPRARSYIVDHIKPGGSITRKFQVCNGTAAAITVQVYANEARITNGSFLITEGRVQNDLATWTSVDKGTVTIPSGKSQALTATIAVPIDATKAERYGVILAELPAKPNSAGVAIASRVGIRMYLDVGPGGESPSDFTVDSMQAARQKDGKALVKALVHNTGARALDMRGELTLTDGPGGLSGGPFPATLGTTLAPGETEPVTVVLPEAIRGGPWTARLDLQSGLLKRSAEAKLTFPDEAGATTAVVKAKNLPLAKDRRVLLPIAGGLIFILFLLLITVGYLSSRRKAKDRRELAAAAGT